MKLCAVAGAMTGAVAGTVTDAVSGITDAVAETLTKPRPRRLPTEFHRWWWWGGNEGVAMAGSGREEDGERLNKDQGRRVTAFGRWRGAEGRF